MPQTERVTSGAPWEPRVGYCRAVRSGRRVFISGTAPIDDHGNVVGPDDGYRQARRCLEIIEASLAKWNADLSCVVRTRMFVTDITRWEEFGRAHGERFRDTPPATTMVEVARLIGPDMLIEIEADAVLPEPSGAPGP